MTEFRIDDQHPVTPQNRSVYPFSQMKVKDSFYVDGSEQYARARIAAYSYGRRNGSTFSCRAEVEGGRIWRIG